MKRLLMLPLLLMILLYSCKPGEENENIYLSKVTIKRIPEQNTYYGFMIKGFRYPVDTFFVSDYVLLSDDDLPYEYILPDTVMLNATNELGWTASLYKKSNINDEGEYIHAFILPMDSLLNKNTVLYGKYYSIDANLHITYKK